MSPLTRRRALTLLAAFPTGLGIAPAGPARAAEGIPLIPQPPLPSLGEGEAAAPDAPRIGWAQAAMGRIAVRSDGAIFLVQAGRKHPVLPDPEIDDEGMAAMPDGEPVLFLSTGAATGEAPASTPAGGGTTRAASVSEGQTGLPGYPGPAGTLIGQKVSAKGSNEQPLSVTVVDARWLDSYPGTTGTRYAAGTFAMLVVEVTNNGQASSYCGAYSLQLLDERNRRHDASRLSVAGATERAWGFPDGTNPRINPGLTRRSLLAFDIPPDIQRLTLVPFKR